MSEGVGESVVEPCCKLTPFLVGESGVHTVGFGIFQVNLLVCHVEVATHYHRFLLVESLDICEEIVFPSHSVVKTLESVLRIRHIHAHEIELLHLQCDDTSLVVVLVDTYTICHAQRIMACIYSRTRVAFLVGIVPIRCIALKFEVELSSLHLCLLQAEKVSVELFEYVAEPFSYASSQSVYIP